MQIFLDKLPVPNEAQSPVTYASQLQNGSRPASSPRVQPSSTQAEVLVLSPAASNQVTPSAVKDMRNEVTEVLKDMGVAFLKVNEDSGKLSVGFANKNDKAQAEKLISSTSQLANKNYSMKSSEKMLPKLTITNVPSDIINRIPTPDPSAPAAEASNYRKLVKECIVESIKCKNHALKPLIADNHTLEVVYVDHSSNGRNLTVAIKVSPAIRMALMNAQGGRLFIGNGCHPFSDRYHFKVCYHCQCIGHKSFDCPKKEETPTCLYCAGDHHSKVCPDKQDLSKRKCSKCSQSRYARVVNGSHSHNSASPLCPITKREILRLENNTDLVSKNVM